ncbi:hypothetical protein C4577_02825 [Candidatus Parcubacteria bacterium]|nr:MAG: hypothetical protein C4577_02825 [Candidatus Parcubacteria bacterium]
MKKQKILTMSTCGYSLRSCAESWGAEDGNLIDLTKEIGYSLKLRTPLYKTPMHAIADGWRLMVPPKENGNGVTIYYEWWFEKYE